MLRYYSSSLALFKHDTSFSPSLHYQGVAMAISTTAFGVYFSLMSEIHDPTAEEPQNNLAWLALASIAVFITGEILHFQAKLFILKAVSGMKGCSF